METDDRDPDPLAQFRTWLGEAEAAGLHEPNAMVLATAGADGRPNARFVLLRGLDERGFEFYTNYKSPKARALEANPRAALVFGWGPIHRQVRITGDVERVSPEESDAYWSTRPRGAQIGAWASPQSEELPSRAPLEAAVAEHEARFAGGEVPRPEHWGGFRVVPDEMEFWYGRPNRLHDRIRYRRVAPGPWTKARLAP